MNHTLYACPPDCTRPNCPICDGGLAHCTVCGGAEGSLPTECPRERMNEETERAVYARQLDYRGGVWVLPRPAGSAS